MPSNVTDNYKPLNVTDIYYTLYGTIFLPPTAQSLSVFTFSYFKVLMILFYCYKNTGCPLSTGTIVSAIILNVSNSTGNFAF